MSDVIAELSALIQQHPELTESLQRCTDQLRRQETRIQQLNSLLDISAQLNSARDFQLLLQMILQQACDLIDAETSSIFLVDPDTDDLVMALATNIPADTAKSIRVPRGRGIVGKSVDTGETVFVPDVSTDPSFYGKVDTTTSFVTRSIICVPLRIHPVSLNAEERKTLPPRVIGAAEVLNKRHGIFSQEDVELFESLCTQVAVALETSQLTEQLHATFLGVASALAASIDAKDDYTHGHSARVADFSTAIGRGMQLPPDQVNTLNLCAILHDVGKIGIPDIVLNKPGSLTDEEFQQLKQHPTIGYDIMRNVPAFQQVARSLSEHHERLDGKGYPVGLIGDVISLFGRIIAVADAFDAMTSSRVYRSALPTLEAFRRLNLGSGTQFDPDIVVAFEEAYRRGDITPASGDTTPLP